MKQPLHRCQNCQCSLESPSNYCDNCGQKRIDQPPSVKELLRDFFSNIWALDNKLLRTMGSLLFRPGQLTLAYLQGIRKGYYTPFKLFLFWLTISFLLLNTLLQKLPELQQVEQYNFKLKAYKINTQKNLKTHFSDSLEHSAIDSILALGLPKNGVYEDTIVSIMDHQFSVQELQRYTPQELIEREQIDNFIQQQFFIQLLKAYKEPGAFQKYLVGHLSWLILLSIPFLALWMRLLYWRKHPLYLQHVVFLLHVHTFILVVATGLALWKWLLLPASASSMLKNLLLFTSLGYSFIALRVVYQQGWRKTLLKFFLFLIGYSIVFALVIILFVLLNFLLF